MKDAVTDAQGLLEVAVEAADGDGEATATTEARADETGTVASSSANSDGNRSETLLERFFS